MNHSVSATRASSHGQIDETVKASEFKYVDESKHIRTNMPVNAMSVDVEDYFQVSAFEGRIQHDQWERLPGRVVRNVERILQNFEQSETKATFFTLGWIAEKYPDLVRAIVAEGHEIASHGYNHSRVWTQSPNEFLDDVSRTKDLLEDLSGTAVTGYRAASFSIGQTTPWAHDVLLKAGYRYSSSIYPIKHDHYGFPSAPRFSFRFEESGLVEIPLTTAAFAGRNWPAAGGGYFRLLPMAYSRWALRRVNESENMPGVFYFHPWEIDPDQPRVSEIPLTTKFRHYVNLNRFENRLKKILREFTWGRMDHVFRSVIADK